MSHVFADHFSRVALGYASFRPWYPASLYPHPAGPPPARGLAWDWAAGSGQATRGLVLVRQDHRDGL